MAFRTLIALLLVVAAVSAFVPIANRHQTASKGTQLQFGFLKELGLEKPSWLPDFGGKKEEEDTTNMNELQYSVQKRERELTECMHG